MVFEINQSLFWKIFSFSGQSVFLDWLGIFLADWMIWLIIAWILARLFFQKRKFLLKEGFLILAVGMMNWLAAGLIQETLALSRPAVQLGIEPLVFHRQAGTFPSGHTAFIFGSIFFYFFRSRQFSWPIFILALFTGLARIYTGAHFPLDIAGGAILGGLMAYLTYCILGKFLPRNNPDQPL